MKDFNELRDMVSRAETLPQILTAENTIEENTTLSFEQFNELMTALSIKYKKHTRGRGKWTY